MIDKKKKLSLLLLIFLAYPCLSQEKEKLLELFIDEILGIVVHARAHQTGQEAFWDVTTTIPTISGRAVSVRLEGKTIIIIARLTPYNQKNKKLLLMAQGEMWVLGDPDEKSQHYSLVDSFEVRLGEKIIFLPLGIEGGENSGSLVIELEIEIIPYKDMLQEEKPKPIGE